MIVRHPVDRIVSEFKFQSRKPSRFYRRFFFSRWLRHNLRLAAKDPYRRDNHFRPQSEFEAFGPEIFRLEEGLAPCFHELATITGLEPPARDIHLLRSRRVEIEIGRDELELIRDFYCTDFERYGYQLD